MPVHSFLPQIGLKMNPRPKHSPSIPDIKKCRNGRNDGLSSATPQSHHHYFAILPNHHFAIPLSPHHRSIPPSYHHSVIPLNSVISQASILPSCQFANPPFLHHTPLHPLHTTTLPFVHHSNTVPFLCHITPLLSLHITFLLFLTKMLGVSTTSNSPMLLLRHHLVISPTHYLVIYLSSITSLCHYLCHTITICLLHSIMPFLTIPPLCHSSTT